MITTKKSIITVQSVIKAPVTKIWDYWTDPKHIIHWNNASDDWHTPIAENNLRVGGRFLSRMESRDGKIGFDFSGQYLKVEPHSRIEYVLDDNRKVQISFVLIDNDTVVTETFEAEGENAPELQQNGWQAILDNFKKYAESKCKMELIHFETHIHASAEKVFKTMLDENKWKQWTTEFNPTSRYEGSWEKGSRMLFLGTESNGKTGGMVSLIRENIPNKFICIEHLGMLEDGKEVHNKEAQEWFGATENYTFNENNGITQLTVEMDIIPEYISYFQDTWPKALKKLKEICEN
jgi:uncharacterized protein YndB with AHSA1/START domain